MENGNFIYIVQSELFGGKRAELLMAFPTHKRAEAYIKMLKSEMKELGGELINSDGDCYDVDFMLNICCVEFSADFPCN